MKHLLIASLFILSAFNLKAQTDPELNYQFNDNNGCASDLLVRIYAIYANGDVVGYSNWFNLTTFSGANLLDYADIDGTVGWDVDPGSWSSLNDYAYGQFEVKNCNTPSTGGTPVAPCFSGALDGVLVEPNLSPSGCFEYSTNCISCLSGQVVEVNSGNNSVYIHVLP